MELQRKLFSLQDAAEVLGISVPFLRKYIRGGSIVPVYVASKPMLPAEVVDRIATQGMPTLVKGERA